jgi:hypothetical protein
LKQSVLRGPEVIYDMNALRGVRTSETAMGQLPCGSLNGPNYSSDFCDGFGYSKGKLIVCRRPSQGGYISVTPRFRENYSNLECIVATPRDPARRYSSIGVGYL